MFHHHATNDLIRVSDGSQLYSDTVDAFAADNGAAVPALPPGAIERIYEPGVRHTISNGSSVIAGGPMPWPPGDAAIAAVSTLRTTQAKRNAPPPAPPKATAAPSQTGKSTGTATVAS